MKYKVLIPSIIIAGLIAFFSFKHLDGLGFQSKNQHEVILKTVLGIVENGHYSPKNMDDTFSSQVFENIFKNLDYDKKFFLQSDIDELAKYKYQIDDQLKDLNLDFFTALNAKFVQRINESENYYKKALSGNITFDTDSKIETDAENLAFPTSKEQLQERWNLIMKHRVLAKYYELKKEQDQKLKDSTNYKALSKAELTKKSVESILKAQERFYKRLKKLNDNDRFAMFINTVTGTHDPHTNYMQPTDKKRFDEMMSGHFIGIGATLQQMDDGRVKVTSIVTGSPSWKQGQLKTEDIIEKVAQGNEPAIEVDGFELEDIIKMIRGKAGTIVKLSVAKPDGSKVVIPIERGKVEFENVFAKSAIIEEEGKKIGIIVLPEFYANFSDLNDRRSSTDVEKEVYKLMNEGVDGIILDVRNNGGGSLSDVVDIVGLFVGEGPVVQVRSSGNNTSTYRSRKKEAIYHGPLAIMINSGSASASEILAAAIQDYKRGIVIGSKSFGKGTVQKLITLDQFVSSADRKMIIDQLNASKGDGADFDGIGSLKLTMQKFYRIDGGSTQIKGVTPDILLPDAYQYLEDIGENKDKNALPWDKVQASNYKKFFDDNGFTTLIQLSQTRTANNESFKIIDETAKRVKTRRDNSLISLKEADFFQLLKEGEDLSKRIEQIDSLSTGINIKNLKVDYPNMTIDEAAKTNNDKWLKGMSKDPFIKETVFVLNDWIHNRARITAVR